MDDDTDLIERGWAALSGGRADEAIELARAMVERAGALGVGHWDYGNLLHDGHVIHGWVALNSGIVTEAEEHLRLAGQTPGSPQLNSFGPDLTLAWALLRRGSDSAVVEYLHGIASFWSPGGRVDLRGWGKT